MRDKKRILLFFLVILGLECAGQVHLKGTVSDEESLLTSANIQIPELQIGTYSSEGRYDLIFNWPQEKDSIVALVSFVGYKSQSVTIGRFEGSYTWDIKLVRSFVELEDVEISTDFERQRKEVSIYTVEPKSVRQLTSAFGDFSQVIALMPGVVANNELSSTYSVRGGNFDENVVYVNGLSVYRPVLVKAGWQEGLSFVNPDLVEETVFSSGGWQPMFGDKLSSVLDLSYRRPTKFNGSATISLLSNSLHVEDAVNRFTYQLGFRIKSAQYLLNTLETKGDYRPRFFDTQLLLGYDLTKDGKTRLELFSTFARNNYLTIPESRESTFGTFNEQLRVFVEFEGRDELEYNTFQNALTLSHEFNERLIMNWNISMVRSYEWENQDLEGIYRICDIDNNPGSPTFNDCVAIRGEGTNYSYARNKFVASIYSSQARFNYDLSDRSTLDFGISFSQEEIDDDLSEYELVDSLGYVNVARQVSVSNVLSNSKYTAYVQQTLDVNRKVSLNYGLRMFYSSLNNEFFINPRLQFSIAPDWRKNIIFRFAAGTYYQPIFYREIRGAEGELYTELTSQKSAHFIGGFDYDFKMWNRDFKIITELYYKDMWDIIPYQVDNVSIRYNPENTANAYAVGADFRISGEFIPGEESWLSLGLLSTKEDVVGDELGYQRRPTDQRFTLGINFQDHLPNDPTLKMNMNYQFGTGLPFGPPGYPQYKNAIDGKSYQRVDIGFSKSITLEKSIFYRIWFGIEVLNLFGNQNVISYLWISDINNNQLAIPNTLSARYFNFKAKVSF